MTDRRQEIRFIDLNNFPTRRKYTTPFKRSNRILLPWILLLHHLISGYSRLDGSRLWRSSPCLLIPPALSCMRAAAAAVMMMMRWRRRRDECQHHLDPRGVFRPCYSQRHRSAHRVAALPGLPAPCRPCRSVLALCARSVFS